MATKKKYKSKQVKRKKALKKPVITKLAKRKISPRSAKKKARGTKSAGAKAAATLRKNVRRTDQSSSMPAFPSERMGARSGGQSSDLQGLSKIEEADSESVGE